MRATPLGIVGKISRGSSPKDDERCLGISRGRGKDRDEQTVRMGWERGGDRHETDNYTESPSPTVYGEDHQAHGLAYIQRGSRGGGSGSGGMHASIAFEGIIDVFRMKRDILVTAGGVAVALAAFKVTCVQRAIQRKR